MWPYVTIGDEPKRPEDSLAQVAAFLPKWCLRTKIVIIKAHRQPCLYQHLNKTTLPMQSLMPFEPINCVVVLFGHRTHES